MLLVALNPLVCGLPRDAKPFRKLRHGAVVQQIIFDQTLLLFSHGNTSPGHQRHLLFLKVLPMSLEFVLPMSLEHSVTYVPDSYTSM